jgi:hypothetical protein
MDRIVSLVNRGYIMFTRTNTPHTNTRAFKKHDVAMWLVS